MAAKPKPPPFGKKAAPPAPPMKGGAKGGKAMPFKPKGGKPY